ncbi:hypothetical protein J056_004011 [Wallemia ichthyophaga EXF-994]|uniref:Pectate lyase n=1 Tax=Wallemia ichthyophaga (strain EXF-994 / CBS 113033) TaxID=1299270 RepID=R9AI48_WALI9|nr:uncharacterized protein J056_004011 [Wallemia ichthyophaga EXF-994]EOR01775.1 hypothetical protein J056_004011 [Wallemia ichthyophaga EXF-994]
MQIKLLSFTLAIFAAVTAAQPALKRAGTNGDFQFAGTKDTAANSGEFKGKDGNLL